MFNLHVVQAKAGDCFILEYSSGKKPKFILIDGGPSGVYKKSLSKVLAEIKTKTDKLELVVVSHIDDDHIKGILDWEFTDNEFIPNPNGRWNELTDYYRKEKMNVIPI